MLNKECLRCKSTFYTSQAEADIFCPFCGYSFKSAEVVRRGEIRESVEKESLFSNGFGDISVKTVDISKSGLGIEKMGKLPFKSDDILNVVIDDLHLKRSARVVWVENNIDVMSRAGMKYC